jgi:hypothetical protein
MSVIIQLSPDDERENEYVKDVKRSTRRESSSCETIHTELTYIQMTNYLQGSLQKNVQLFWIIYYLKKKTSWKKNVKLSKSFTSESNEKFNSGSARVTSLIINGVLDEGNGLGEKNKRREWNHNERHTTTTTTLSINFRWIRSRALP